MAEIVQPSDKIKLIFILRPIQLIQPMLACTCKSQKYVTQYFNLTKLNKRQRKPKGQSKMDNPENLATQGTQDENKTKTKSVVHHSMQTNTNNIIHFNMIENEKHQSKYLKDILTITGE